MEGDTWPGVANTLVPGEGPRHTNLGVAIMSAQPCRGPSRGELPLSVQRFTAEPTLAGPLSIRRSKTLGDSCAR